MKTFGIYLAYPPGVTLSADGLGRHLVAFMKAARDRNDVTFVIACPSWQRKSLQKLFQGHGLPWNEDQIIGPQTEPKALRLYEWYRTRRGRGRLLNLLRPIQQAAGRLLTGSLSEAGKTLVTTRSTFLLLIGSIVAVALSPLILLVWIASVIQKLWRTAKYIWRHRSNLRTALRRRSQLVDRFSAVSDNLRSKPERSSTVVQLYKHMEQDEARLILDHIGRRPDVLAWYTPAAFWPQFNQINRPRLICVPDVVLSEFPLAFSNVGGERFLQSFISIEDTITGGETFVTYSEKVKYQTLVDRYQTPIDRVFVVPHGANDLKKHIAVSGLPDNVIGTRMLCENIFKIALAKNRTVPATNAFNKEMKFLFYASQIRPNKNVVSLLRAYDFLLKRRYVGHKLILTGDPKGFLPVADFIAEHNLHEDVLCLHDLSEQELAACYHLADLAVNPSLSEGGCPFTFTEALSVGTPVVMSRIAVTEEVITDIALQDIMLFDGYDWKDMATRIEWALNNKDTLQNKQLAFYEHLSKRTWRNVVDEHIAILERISEPAGARSA
jgi:glycosyltransferase involved in cell wall biosynthesis